MTYSKDLKLRIFKNILSKKYSDSQIIDIFKISRRTFYKIKNISKLKHNRKYTLLKKSSSGSKNGSNIGPKIKTYIKKYVQCKIFFDYKILIGNIKRLFNKTISKSSIYKTLSDACIKKKKICKKFIPTEKKNELFKLKRLRIT